MFVLLLIVILNISRLEVRPRERRVLATFSLGAADVARLTWLSPGGGVVFLEVVDVGARIRLIILIIVVIVIRLIILIIVVIVIVMIEIIAVRLTMVRVVVIAAERRGSAAERCGRVLAASPTTTIRYNTHTHIHTYISSTISIITYIYIYIYIHVHIHVLHIHILILYIYIYIYMVTIVTRLPRGRGPAVLYHIRLGSTRLDYTILL